MEERAAMPDPEFGKITDDRVARAQAQVGIGLSEDHLLPSDEGASPRWQPREMNYNRQAAEDNIRHFVFGYGDDNPLYTDPSYGGATRWEGLIAPPTFVWTMARVEEPPRRLQPEYA